MRVYNEASHWWYEIVYFSASVITALGLVKWLGGPYLGTQYLHLGC